VKKAIALKGGLVDLVWDGNLKRQQVKLLSNLLANSVLEEGFKFCTLFVMYRYQ
jgi:hypothetical protein